MVVRDVNGMVLASCAKKKYQPYKAMEIESLAAVTTLSFATNLGFRRIILEGDSYTSLVSENRVLNTFRFTTGGCQKVFPKF